MIVFVYSYKSNSRLALFKEIQYSFPSGIASVSLIDSVAHRVLFCWWRIFHQWRNLCDGNIASTGTRRKVGGYDVNMKRHAWRNVKVYSTVQVRLKFVRVIWRRYISRFESHFKAIAAANVKYLLFWNKRSSLKLLGCMYSENWKYRINWNRIKQSRIY